MTRIEFPTGPAPLHREEAHTSWWTTAPREAFTAEALKKQERMARSQGAQRITGVVIGWSVSGRKP